MLVFLNGQIIKEEDAKISISDLSYQFGYGLFETIRCEKGIPVFLEDHYRRLTHSAKEIGMPFPVEIDEIKSWVKDILQKNNLQNARLKIIISKRMESGGEKFNVLITAMPLDSLPQSYSLLSYKLGRDFNSISFKHKTTSRADSYFAYKQAIESGFNDVIYLNEKNELIECSRANIFLLMEDKIITSLLETGILSGVTRSKVLEIAKKDSIPIEEKNINSLFLKVAKGAFITNAIVGIMPVSKIKLEDKEYSFQTGLQIINFKNAYRQKLEEYLKRKNSELVSRS